MPITASDIYPWLRKTSILYASENEDGVLKQLSFSLNYDPVVPDWTVTQTRGDRVVTHYVHTVEDAVRLYNETDPSLLR